MVRGFCSFLGAAFAYAIVCMFVHLPHPWGFVAFVCLWYATYKAVK